MGKDIGSRIKYHRLSNNLTQSDLSEGIISISYLSKIENGVADPPEEIIGLLCAKLNINPKSIESQKLVDLCDNWFKALFHKNMKEVDATYKQINENMNFITDTSLLHLIEIHKLRYYLIQKSQQKASEQYILLQSLSKHFNSREMYYWLKFSGYYYFTNLSYSKALNLFQKAKEYIKVCKYNCSIFFDYFINFRRN
ncbi:helix-turn-helix domain-containing protein [Oceanobacillus bengalensis]|uniref:Helix-turn-helix domain-containing protein n=1 Tax=Oceanobacillus bengalensis TaxID=1435466 RepID=A0A494Z2B6_9BACI|nr:helix-turn-helix domain-containing protein [Oceanobacillus bengalensis]RKQ16541.1 helix-turn-helix domain-containing protein [Oceanobacillus bengalensis]